MSIKEGITTLAFFLIKAKRLCLIYILFNYNNNNTKNKFLLLLLKTTILLKQKNNNIIL
uniref:Uncharacterized protein n=1 Tax=viral metagenome TaxID=1070528 RepID=A0A6C0KTU4_9ZZZZ